MFRPGDILDATLHDIPDLGDWTIHARATVLNVSTLIRTTVRLALRDPASGATIYAYGALTVAPEAPSRLGLRRPITTGLTPARISLGEPTGRLDSSAVDPLAEAASTALNARFQAAGSGPLGPDALPLLDAAVDRLQHRRDQVADAEQARNSIALRLLAGGVEPKLITRPGLSTSRISQIKTESERAGSEAPPR